MINRIDALKYSSDYQGLYCLIPFYKNSSALKNAPRWGMSLKRAGSMRFRWNETNKARDAFLTKIAASKEIAAVELIHSKKVIDIKAASDTQGVQCDGIITTNKSIIPVVTVADCMPLFLYDSVSGAFGVVHSGWKGTGIVGEAILAAQKNYGARPQDFCVAIGPHIRECCYVVDKERADYFTSNFCPECVAPVCEGKFSLSLEKANLSVLTKLGVKEENIVIADNCTSCQDEFGSFRREAAFLDIPNEQKALRFTVQAAFVI